ncbi:hypothetical protein AAVH_11876 [Aphelenchoides avenae]|nr:hypothetical protein AAVH_11876 [Aphelenchus avenae]
MSLYESALYVLCFTASIFCLVESHLAHGVRQRNSSMPLRQLIDRSKSRSTALEAASRLNSTATAPAMKCAHCDLDRCRQKTKRRSDTKMSSNDELFCYAVRNDPADIVLEYCTLGDGSIKVMVKDTEVHLVDGANEACLESSLSADIRICWCRHSGDNKPMPPAARNRPSQRTNSRTWRLQSPVSHAARGKQRITYRSRTSDVSARSFAAAITAESGAVARRCSVYATSACLLLVWMVAIRL